jgi:hypothetical protein
MVSCSAQQTLKKVLKSDLSDSEETGFWEVDRIGKSSSAVNFKFGRWRL